MKDRQIREKFREYFEGLGHSWYDSISLIPDDPSILFTTAGMVQFKKQLLGDSGKLMRAASIQRCLRTTDIDEVGRTSRHLTFFEMYGNFSFGDYFKEEAIKWGWEFLSGTLGLSEAKLHATVYEDDDEAFEIWKKYLPAEKIHRLGEADNFWKMGDTGPCGPCSEVLYDRGPGTGCKSPECAPGCACDRYMEVWNFVFTQYDRQPDGSLKELPKKNIDTGMGLERLNQVLSGASSVFETETLKPLMDRVRLEAENYSESSARIVADHARAAAFLICDGISPSNEGRGYVLRRLIRRALREGKKLGWKEPALWKYTSLAADIFADYYPAILQRANHIAMVCKAEEEAFLGTLESAERILGGYIEKMEKAGTQVLDAESAFKLYDTYGMPLDITINILEDRGYSADRKGFDKLLEERAAAKSWQEKEAGISYWNEIKDLEKTEFTGYGELTSEARVLKVMDAGRAVVLDRSPMYAESGGQAGDSGLIQGSAGIFKVTSTVKEEGVFIHRGEMQGDVSEGEAVLAKVDYSSRKASERNHTATHLLQGALRKVLGPHVQQNGSYVGPERLRFDYTHMEALTTEQIERIEDIVNDCAMRDLPVRCAVLDKEEALEKGALAFFGEKYAAKVRAVTVSGYEEGEPLSIELCGGTHIGSTGEIGVFKIVSESGVASGVRRIEALTGTGALSLIRKKEELLKEAALMVKAPEEDVTLKIGKLLDEIKENRQKINNLENKLASGSAGGTETLRIENVELSIREFDGAGAGVMRGWADSQVQGAGKVALALSGGSSGATIILKISSDLTSDFSAGGIVSEASRVLGGSGGGRKDMAQGGGPDTEALPRAKEAVIESFRRGRM